MSSGPSARRITVLLTALVVAGIVAVVIPFLLPPPAFVEFELTDVIFGSDLMDEVAYVVDLDRESRWALPIRRTGGGFSTGSLRVPSGPAQFEISVAGYSSVRLSDELERLASVRRTIALEPTFGRLEVRVLDATTSDQPVMPSARIIVGDQTAEATGDQPAVFELEEGRYEVEVAAIGYCSQPQSVEVKAREMRQLTMRIPPDLTAGERARILLEWGERPRDLDAHFAVSEPSRPLSSYHVYFANREGRVEGPGSLAFARLDVDWLNSEGVETITVNDLVEGNYRYFVHHYAGNGTLETSEAIVTLITAGCQRRRFEVPSECRERWWHVADIDAEGDELTIAERGTCSPAPPVDWSRGGKG